MGKPIEERLALLNEDFESVVGSPFDHFYCPILFTDKPARLCRGHLYSRAFPNTARRWTIQRKDVDGFFGSLFEADFSDLKFKGVYPTYEFLLNRKLAKRVRARVKLDCQEVEYYPTKGPVPKDHVMAKLDMPTGQISLGIKLHPDTAKQMSSVPLNITIEKDARLAAVVSLIRSAHLTLFDMLGYRWALSAAGHFVGHDILGKFFKEHIASKRKSTLQAAMDHFKEFSHMVRPLAPKTEGLRGTISDGHMSLCKDPSAEPWGVVIYIRLADTFHAVLMPIFEGDWAPRRFLDFIGSDEEDLTTSRVTFIDDKWLVSKRSEVLHWPKKGCNLT